MCRFFSWGLVRYDRLVSVEDIPLACALSRVRYIGSGSGQGNAVSPALFMKPPDSVISTAWLPSAP
jgi:hypothetical protein